MEQLSDIVGRIINGDYASILIVLVAENDQAITYTAGGYELSDILTELQASIKLKEVNLN